MRKEIKIALSLVIAAVIAMAGWKAFDLRDPLYQGRPLHDWLKDMDGQHPEAEEAIRNIGSNAVPQIIAILKTRDSSPNQRLVKWASEHHLLKSNYVPVANNHRHAALACYVIGPDAKPAIPFLVALLNGGFTGGSVGAALGRMGPAGVDPLVGCLASTNDTVRAEAVWVLGHFQSNAPVVLPTLIHCLKDKSFFVQTEAAISIGDIGREPKLAVPALLEILENGRSHPQVRWCACLSLGKFKQEAQSATAPLLAALTDSDPSVRGTAAIALVQIHPQDHNIVEKAMPFLIEDLRGLQGPNIGFPLNFRHPAIRALEECASEARPAVPALLECLQDKELYMRQAAGRALKAIDPEAAAKAGIK